MTELAFYIVAAVNTLIGVGVVIAMFLYRHDRNREALETRMIAVLMLIGWVRFFVGLPTAQPFTSAAVASALLAVSIYLLRPPQSRHLIPWLTRSKDEDRSSA